LNDSVVKRFDDVNSNFGKLLEDVGNNFGKRLDDVASRILSHDRTHLFFFGIAVGLFGLTFNLFGDLVFGKRWGGFQ
jgi:hypothetical protein